jgi:hypothetical protein
MNDAEKNMAPNLAIETPDTHGTIEMQSRQRASFSTKRKAGDAIAAVDGSPRQLAL